MRLLILLVLLCLEATTAFGTDPIPISSEHCSFFSLGRFFKEPMDHGSPYCYLCKTCSDDDQSAICPRCRNCCHQGHEVVEVEPAPYFCDCGAGTFGKMAPDCQLKPDSHKKCPSFNATIKARLAYLTLFKKLANPTFSLTLSVTTLKDQILSSSAIEKNRSGEIIKLSSDNVCTVFDEKFVDGFDPKNTQNRTIHNAMDATWQWPFMHDFTRTHYRYLKTKEIIAAELPYVSGNKLIVIMATPNEKKETIFYLTPETWNDAITQILNAPICALVKPLFLPKVSLKSKAKSILGDTSITQEFFSGLLKNTDDIQQAGLFNLDERGSLLVDTSMVETINSEVDALIFNRPFLAIVMDKKNQPLIISYINFDN